MIWVMTEVTRWRDPAARRSAYHAVHGLPEPPRSGHVSRSSGPPKDLIGRALEEWLAGLALASTVDAD
jgi:hypothetical protein